MAEIQPAQNHSIIPSTKDEGKIDPPAFLEEGARISEDLKRSEQPVVAGFTGKHADMYAEALEKYGREGSIPEEAEKRLKR